MRALLYDQSQSPAIGEGGMMANARNSRARDIRVGFTVDDPGTPVASDSHLEDLFPPR
jgi:hypothetical protein